ncbi:hypothetical protein P43SY_007591 [Pythium insidiosum]|uniref:DNA 3'-5' helicase n=1 Tax=Pythium insidiosum TaxID=114742 RepID=A0AAD5Q3X5_PYTIN|nr:hypothetical protein P43SY_007591 [Pythium insidiosum]
MMRGLTWTQQRPGTRNDASQGAQEVAPDAGEQSFEEVFAEVFGAERQRVCKALAPLAPLGDDDQLPGTQDVTTQPPPCTSTSTTATTSQQSNASQTTATTRSDAKTDSRWTFAAPSAIDLTVFDMSTRDRETDRSTPLDSKRGNATAFARYKDENASHSVSDNFVRLTMRRRVRGSTGRAKKRPEYLRSRGPRDDALDDHGGNKRRSAKDPTERAMAGDPLLQDGVDFLDECLEVLQKIEREREIDRPVCKDTSSAEPEPECAPPRCHHALECQRLVVKKKNSNHGRAFFACPLGHDEGRCDFFLWEDNHTPFALRRLRDGTSAAPPELDDDSPLVPLDLSQPLALQRDALRTNLRLVFGHSDFRPGQQWAIERVLERRRTLLVLPTGSGKSLCYQFPALFLPGVTLVISPLIALMNDQFDGLPPRLQRRARCLTGSASRRSAASKAQYADLVRDLLGGGVKLLFVSPEKALTRGFQRVLRQLQTRLSLVCVDEAHCISEWSHHFRPSYLRLAALFEQAESVLAITATASRRVERDILAQLQPANAAGDDMVLRMPWQRENLRLGVVRVVSDEQRLECLVGLLADERRKRQGAMIMYVHQQRQAEALAALLQEQLAARNPAKWASAAARKAIAFYHANMDSEAKEKVRMGFLSGRVRLVIATIAFGMGIDKQNVRLVLHYHAPSSIEHYLQQVGRAGRDGRPASALLFLLDDDVRTFRSLLFSNALHRLQLERLVALVTCLKTDAAVVTVPANQRAREYRVWIDVKRIEKVLDMKAAMVETFLTLLSLQPTIRETMVVTIRPTAMAWCELSLLDSGLRTTDELLSRLVALLTDSQSASLGTVEVDVKGYLRTLHVRFHVVAVASQLLSAPAEAASLELLQRVRSWQLSGQILDGAAVHPTRRT